MTPKKFVVKRFVIIIMITSIWVQFSETFRYLMFVIPKMEETGIQMPKETYVVYIIWMLWGTLLSALTVFLFWMYATIFGNTLRTILIAATLSWAFVFVLFWVGAGNMNLLDWSFLSITLPLSWFELLVASYIASKLYAKDLKIQTI